MLMSVATDLNEPQYICVVVVAATLVDPEDSVSEVMDVCLDVKGKE